MSTRAKLALGLIAATLGWLVLVAGIGAFSENDGLRELLQVVGPVLILLALVAGHFLLGEDEDPATPG